MAAYQQEFEKLSNKVDDLLQKLLVGSFVGGMKDEVRLEVWLKQPKYLANAIGLARLVEERIDL